MHLLTKQIVVGLTERHGVYDEIVQFPADGVNYTFLKVKRFGSKIFRSPLKGYMSDYDTSNCDIVESVMSPIITNKPWIYSLALFQEALAWDLFGLPTPKVLRKKYMQHLFLRDNCKKLIFWSYAGRETLAKYGKIDDARIWQKTEVVYPAIRYIPDRLIRYNERKVNILFSGSFFIKGGINVVDAFERAQKFYNNIYLRLCCDENIDFNTPNKTLRRIYLEKIKSNRNIILGRVTRYEMLNEQIFIFYQPMPTLLVLPYWKLWPLVYLLLQIIWQFLKWLIMAKMVT